MRVDEIMCTHLETCRPEDSLQAAAQSMWDNDIGILRLGQRHGLGQVGSGHLMATVKIR